MAALLQRNGHRAQQKARMAYGASGPGESLIPNDASWSHWQAGYFRSVLSQVLLAVAAYILCSAAYHYHSDLESTLMSVVGILVAWQAFRQSRKSRTSQVDSF
jgi:hypothetical protein